MSKKGIFFGYLFLVLVVVIFFFIFQEKDLSQNNFNEEINTFVNKGLETKGNDMIENEVKNFVIKSGEGLDEISERLKEKELIKSEFIFKIYAFLSQARSKFWPGEYKIKKGSELKDLLQTLIGQPLAPEKTITILEGWTNKKIEEVFLREGLIEEGQFILALEEIINNQSLLEKYEFLLEAKENFYLPYSQDNKVGLQGYLFPDTYRFYEETDAKEIVKKMLANFDQKLDPQLREKIKESPYSLFEILTMASLIEKEAFFDQDRRLIADVFWKRLKAGWALESCATINYILENPKARLSYKDTRISSPYNTYLNLGLPPTPINNPSLSAIQAVVDPLENDYCCFLANEEGKTIFSKTIEEHNQNKAKYLK